MSYATGDRLAPRPVSRPAGLIAGIVTLEALAFLLIARTEPDLRGTEVPWILLDAYLLRKLWHGSYGAWFALAALTIGAIALAALTQLVSNAHMEGGPWAVVRLLLELALLAAPSMRRWVSKD